MDIYTAAKYMKLGYRIRRNAWSAVSYAYDFYGTIYGAAQNAGRFSLAFSMSDLIAEDWEIITEGIIKEFPITYQE